MLHFYDRLAILSRFKKKHGVVVQLVSTSACQAEGRGFKSRRPRIRRSSRLKSGSTPLLTDKGLQRCDPFLFSSGMNMYFTYILQNPSGSFYIGHTNNLENRLMRHNQGRSKYTRNRGPWKIVYSETFNTKSEDCPNLNRDRLRMHSAIH